MREERTYRPEAAGAAENFSIVASRATSFLYLNQLSLCPCRNKKRFHHQALIEVRILEQLRKKDLDVNSQHNVIHMLEYFYFRNHLCISFELMR